MNDAAVEKQISNMVSFIEKEAKEKASEIAVKAEEEFTIEKARLVRTQKQKIQEEFDRKEKKVLVNKKIAHSNELARSRLQILKARESGIQKLYERSRAELNTISSKPEYKQLLVKLILQALGKLNEKSVKVRCRQEDQAIVLAVLPQAKQQYQEQSGGKSVDLLLDTESFLPASPANSGPKALETCAGGVILSGLDGKIVCNNTLDARLQYSYEAALPDIRAKLFA